MNFLRRMLSRSFIVKDLLVFLWERKLWWLIPLLGVLVVMGILVFFVQSSATVPFVYVLF